MSYAKKNQKNKKQKQKQKTKTKTWTLISSYHIHGIIIQTYIFLHPILWYLWSYLNSKIINLNIANIQNILEICTNQISLPVTALTGVFFVSLWCHVLFVPSFVWFEGVLYLISILLLLLLLLNSGCCLWPFWPFKHSFNIFCCSNIALYFCFVLNCNVCYDIVNKTEMNWIEWF